MEEHAQPEEEVHLEPTGEVHLETTEENRTSEQPEVQPVERQQKRKGKERRQEEEDEFVSEEAHSLWKKHYAGKGFIGERGFSKLISPFKELIEQRGWGKFCKHYKTGYASIVWEFYSNLVGRKDNSVFVRGVWVPYGAETINAIYGMEGQKHGSKYKRLEDRPNREKIAGRLTDGKVKWGTGQGEKKIINRGDLTEEAKVWFYFLASVLIPTKHVCTVREQEAVLLYAILKGYKVNVGAIIENSIMKYHEGNKRGLIPHPATITWLCLKAGVKGSWAEEEECPNASPLTLTGVSKGPRNLNKKGIMVEAEARDEEENARQEEDNLMVENQEEQIPETQPEGNTPRFTKDVAADETSLIDFTTPLTSSPPMRNRNFREPRESSRGAQGNNEIMEMLKSMQKSMEEREEKWGIQQQFREDMYETELRRRDQQWGEELNKKEEMFEAELKRKEQKWEEEMSKREEQLKKILEHKEEKFRKEMEERDRDLLKKLKLSHEAFYNNQFDRDSQLLKLIKERDSEQETKTKEHIKGFKFLYMQLLKDFEKKMMDRDKVLDDNDSYRRKFWLENLDLINNNLSKFLEVMTELEHNMNTLGMRQDELNEKVDLTNELVLEEQTEKENVKKKKRMEMKFPEFNPKLDTLDLDPPRHLYS